MATNSIEIIFLDRNSQNIPAPSKKAILILSPSLYWFHKERLDLSLSQAKKIAPSLFEGTIPEGNYSYHVEKVGDEYWFFAYDDSKIIDKLLSLGIKPSQIAKVYPAQIALANLQEPVLANDKILLNEEGTIIAIPKTMFPQSVRSIEEISLSLPKKSLPLKTYSSSLISEEYIYRFSILLFLAILVYAVQVFLSKKDLAKLSFEEQALIQKYHLPPTSLQLRSILSRLHKEQKEQLALRDELDAILRTPLKRGEFLKKVEFGKKIRFEIALLSPQRAQKLKSYFTHKLHVTNLTLSGKNLLVECRR